MKILVVCQHYKPEPFRISDVCETLVQMGHEVTVVTGVPNYPEGNIYPGYEKSWNKMTEINGVRVYRSFTIPRKTGPVFRILNYFSFAWSSKRLVSRLDEEFDVVFVNQLSPVMMAEAAISYAKKWNKRVVLYCLDLWPESLAAGGIHAGSLIYRIFYRISKRIYSAVDQILVSSRSFISYFENYLQIPGKCQYLPQYAEALFESVPAAQRHEPPYHFVFAGNVGEIQSVDTIIAAARILKDDPRAIFDIVGDGSACEQCRELAKDLPNVVFHGRMDIKEMPRFYSMADAMLVSMKNDAIIAGTLPGKVQSCMAAGRCLLGSIGGEAAAVIRERGCGLCAEPENPEQLADLVRQLLDDPDLFAEYGRQSREYYQKYFRKEIFFQKLLKTLEDNCV